MVMSHQIRHHPLQLTALGKSALNWMGLGLGLGLELELVELEIMLARLWQVRP